MNHQLRDNINSGKSFTLFDLITIISGCTAFIGAAEAAKHAGLTGASYYAALATGAIVAIASIVVIRFISFRIWTFSLNRRGTIGPMFLFFLYAFALIWSFVTNLTSAEIVKILFQ